MDRMLISEDIIRPQLLTLREFRPFKTSDDYLYAMKEDLSDWLNTLYPDLNITPTTFMESLDTGVTLCKHANNVRVACVEWINSGKKLPKCWGKEWKMPNGEITFNSGAKPETFFARDNVHNFITWCRKLGIFECLLFESDDLILRKNEKSVILCLLEVARRGSHFGMATPMLVQFEKEIDRDIAKDTGQDLSSSGEEEESFIEHGPSPQIITNDLRSLDEMVRELVERCTCPVQFPMIRITEGKYRIGNTKLMIYVRILRNHVMVRVGGGWTTLGAFLARHDPCRHRTTISSKFIMKNDGNAPRMKVEYERRDLSAFEPVAHSTPTCNKKSLDLSDSSSEISDEGYKTSDNTKILLADTPKNIAQGNLSSKEGGGDNKGHLSRKSTAIRARSLSTDEDRPDSRSTDEEIGHHCHNNSTTTTTTTTTILDRAAPRIMRSSSSSGANVTPQNNKVPRSSSSATVRDGFLSSNSHGRSVSCERPSRSLQLGFRQRYVSGEQDTSSPKSSRTNSAGAARVPQTTSNSHHYGHKRTNSTGGGPTTNGKRSPLANNTSSNNSNSNIKSSISNSASLPTRGCGARSLSGGAVEFFPSYSHNNSSSSRQYYNNSRNAGARNGGGGSLSSRYGPGPQNNTTTIITTTHVKPLGKNTWNGSANITSRSHRNRPNLFSAPYFESENGGGRGGSRKHSHHDDNDDDEDSTNNLSGEFQNGFPNLAEWIKKALELDLDADKISHIEMAIKEFEQKRDKSPELLQQTSLPYTCNESVASSSNTSSNSINNKHQQLLQNPKKTLPIIRQRKETGQTKIPKPNFY